MKRELLWIHMLDSYSIRMVLITAQFSGKSTLLLYVCLKITSPLMKTTEELTEEFQKSLTEGLYSKTNRLFLSFNQQYYDDDLHKPAVIFYTGVQGCEGQPNFNSTIKKLLTQRWWVVKGTQMSK